MRNLFLQKVYSIIFGLIAFALFRGSFIAALIGFFIGGSFDAAQRARRNGGQNQRTSGGGQSFEDIFSYYRQQTQRYDFPTQLLVLSAYVMRSDGKVVKAELNFVKSFLARQFGPQFNVNHLQTLKRFLDAPSLPIEEICSDIRMRAQEEVPNALLVSSSIFGQFIYIFLYLSCI